MKLSRAILLGFILSFLTAQSEILKTDPYLNLIDKIEINIRTISESIENMNKNPMLATTLNSDLIYEEVKKEKCVDEIVNILSEFLQKYIAVEDSQFESKLRLAHKMLTQAFEIKRSTDMKKVDDFRESFKSFKRISQPKYQRRFPTLRNKENL